MKPRYRKAVAIEYQEGDVPRILLQGALGNAEEMVRIATRFGVPVIEDPSLTKALFHLPVETTIPERLYQALGIVMRKVRQILASPSSKL